jgi:hypothetical protein
MIDHFSGRRASASARRFPACSQAAFGAFARVTLSWNGNDADAPAGDARMAARGFLLSLGLG